MLIYDSVLKEKVLLKPIKENEINIYVCGPTVYDDAHLGHAKSSVSFDLLSRTLKALNYKVKLVKNFTDIDDKILNKMNQTGKSLEEITNYYIKSYEDDMSALHILPADLTPKATQSLEAIIDYIQVLLKNKVAYRIKDGIYFDTNKDKLYLSLSGKKEEFRQSRVEKNDEKNDEKDFVLWKFDEKWYKSPFGKGRPGWHTECVAMIKEHFEGDEAYEIDIHAGGIDLLFPHHENEAAQCRCAYHKNLAKYWMHNGFMNIDNEKMSKSLGNSFFVKDALKIVPAEALRFYLMSIHYRAHFNYNLEDLKSSKKRLDKLYRLKKRLSGVVPSEIELKFKNNLLECLSDDLNISAALCVLDEMVNLANQTLDKEPKNKNFKATTAANLLYVNQVLGILNIDQIEWFKWGINDEKRDEIENLLKQREEAKKAKDFNEADKIRNELLEQNIAIMDTPNGTIWEIIWEI